MKKLIIMAGGDNEGLHKEALGEAVKVVEAVNHTPVYRAWIEAVEDDERSETDGLRDLLERWLREGEQAGTSLYQETRAVLARTLR